jgi:hypothetical protein
MHVVPAGGSMRALCRNPGSPARCHGSTNEPRVDCARRARQRPSHESRHRFDVSKAPCVTGPPLPQSRPSARFWFSSDITGRAVSDQRGGDSNTTFTERWDGRTGRGVNRPELRHLWRSMAAAMDSDSLSTALQVLRRNHLAMGEVAGSGGRGKSGKMWEHTGRQRRSQGTQLRRGVVALTMSDRFISAAPCAHAPSTCASPRRRKAPW